MYRMVLSDLDETLLVNHHVPQFNIDAIHNLKKTRFVIATGRAYNMVGEILKEIGTYDKEDEYSICFNGGLIVENKNHKILHFKGLDYELASRLFERGRDLDVCVLVFTLDCCYIYKADENEVERKKTQKAPFKIMEDYDISSLKNEKIAKILFMKRDMEILKSIKNEIEPDFNKEVTFSFSSNRYIEMNAKGIDKGYGLKWLADYLDIPVEETISIGDNYNDVPMLLVAGKGCCVQSATDDIKALSNYVCEHDYGDGAVKAVLEQFCE